MTNRKKKNKEIIRRCTCVLTLILLLKILKKKIIRRWWVKPHLRNEIRYQYGAYHTILMYFKMNDHEDFIEFMHMNVDQFTTLYELMEIRLQKQITSFREPLNPELKLAFVLWFLGHAGNVKQAALMFRIGISTGYKLLEEISRDLINILQPLYVQMPSREQWINIANSYETLWNFLNCIGALDGKHIDIIKPPSAGSYFWSYKKKHSFVLMAVADAYKRFIWYSVGDFGSINDASIFSDTDFARQLRNDELNIPPPKPLPNIDIEMPFMFVADEIFALDKHLIKPYSKSIYLTLEEKVFNYRLKRARLCIECAFGILTKKFKILQQKLNFDLKTSRLMVAAVVCLHNFLITTKIGNDVDNINPNVIEHIPNVHNQYLRMTPIQQRQLLTVYFTSDAGLLEWQYQYI